ncbi:hypothetical protein PoB_004930500 [Plakobranchus ocellatus]|uniref:Uncharacterized protein n=1 Tax=Plakobranchus ocellatus TaxID=259542 RepID=A0AAV4BUI7_9GAST|nr:hypothetical protein PoB_004930500 [Plakobranchus ocellatus]
MLHKAVSATMNDFNSPSTDEPLAGNPRVHREGREYYERNNRGNDWFGHDQGPGPSTQPPHPEARLRSEAARENAQKNRGSMADSLQGYANPPVERTVHPRGVKPEAADIAAGNQGGGMKNLIENYGNLGLSDRPAPKVKGSEAEEYLERQHGSTKVLLNHYSTDPIPAEEMPKQPRLGVGADEIADKHKGEGMGPLMRLEGKKTPREPKISRLHQTSDGGGWDEIPPQSRMRPEGENIAQKNSFDSMGEILAQDNTALPQRQETKVLKHMEESHTPRSTPAARVRLDGIRNMERARNQDEMSAIMHGSPVQNAATQPGSGRRILPHMQRSELW